MHVISPQAFSVFESAGEIEFIAKLGVVLRDGGYKFGEQISENEF